MDWVTSIKRSTLTGIIWIFCPGHSGVKGNERADKLAGEAVVGGSFTLDAPTVLTAVRDHLDNTREETSHTLDILKEKGVQRGDGKQSMLRGPTRRIQNQLLTNTISMKTLRWTLKNRDEWIWVCPDCDDSDSGNKV